VITEKRANITKYKLEYNQNGIWKTIFSGENGNRIKIHRFDRVSGKQVRMVIESSRTPVSIAEFGVFNEKI
jgi:alpha-L-fucosidase